MQTCAARGCVAILIFSTASCALTDRPPGPPPGIAIAYQLLEDPAGTATIEQVAEGPLAARFRPTPERSANLGLTSSVWWLRFALDETHPDAADPAILEVGWPLLEDATFYAQGPDGSFTARSAGLGVPIRDWEFDYRLPSFRIAPDAARTHYLRVASRESIILPLTRWTERGFEAKRRTETAILGFYFGMLLVMAASGVLNYALLREPAFLSYASLVASFALWQASLSGLLSTYLWPDAWWFGTRAMALFAVGTMISTIVFARAFLASRQYAPRLDRASRLAHPVLALFVVWALVWPGPALTYTATPLAMVAAVWMIATALVVARRGYRFAHYFLVTWLFALLAALAQGLRDLGFVGSNLLTDYGLQLGVALTFAALSFGLIGRIFILRDDLHQSADDLRRLEREDAAKRSFLATASHDLRQPLHAIGLLLGALRDRLADARDIALVDKVLAATDEMAAMFGALLDVARLEAATVRPHVVSFDLGATFARLEAEFGALASEKGLDLRRSRRAGDRAQRSAAAVPHPAQPAQQRDPLHGGRRGPPRVARGRRRGRDRGRRQRPRHPRRTAGYGLRALPPARRRERRGGRRSRPRPRHRAAPDHGPRPRAASRFGARSRHHVHHAAAARRRAGGTRCVAGGARGDVARRVRGARRRRRRGRARRHARAARIVGLPGARRELPR